jgi:hypothetical protein
VTEPGGEHAADAVDQADLLDSEAMFRGLNGFEQLAIEQHFRTRIAALADDAFMLMRALLFVAARRDGMNDGDAFRNTMLLPLDDVTGRFEQPDQGDDPDADPTLREQQDREYADFVVGVGLSFMPDQFRALTIGERGALLAAARRAAGKG